MDYEQFNPDDLLITAYPESYQGFGPHRIPNGIRVIHLPTGTVVSCNEDRSQHKNRHTALTRLWEQVQGKPSYAELAEQVELLRTELEKRKNAAARRTEQWKAAVAKCFIAEKLLYAATKIVVRTKGIIPFFVYDLDENLKKEYSNFVSQTDEQCLAQVRAEAVMDFAKDIGLYSPEYDDQGFVEIYKYRVLEYIESIRQEVK
jgi:hypothetical protein